MLAASISKAVILVSVGTVESLGIQEPGSSLARSYAGWRLKVVYASAHERDTPVMAVLFELTRFDEGFLRPLPTLVGSDLMRLSERVAASDLQKSVLFASERH